MAGGRGLSDPRAGRRCHEAGIPRRPAGGAFPNGTPRRPGRSRSRPRVRRRPRPRRGEGRARRACARRPSPARVDPHERAAAVVGGPQPAEPEGEVVWLGPGAERAGTAAGPGGDRERGEPTLLSHTRRPPGAKARSCGAPARTARPSRLPVRALRTSTAELPSIVTHRRRPSGATARSWGLPPTEIERRLRPVRGSSATIRRPSSAETHSRRRRPRRRRHGERRRPGPGPPFGPPRRDRDPSGRGARDRDKTLCGAGP